MSLTLAFPLSAAFLLLLRGHRSRRSISARRERAGQIRILFARFVDANRASSVTPSYREQFLTSTADATIHYPDTVIPILRSELHDQSIRLEQLKDCLADDRVEGEHRSTTAAACSEVQAWFERMAMSLDADFDAERETRLGLRSVYEAGIRGLNRAIGA